MNVSMGRLETFDERETSVSLFCPNNVAINKSTVLLLHMYVEKTENGMESRVLLKEYHDQVVCAAINTFLC